MSTTDTSIGKVTTSAHRRPKVAAARRNSCLSDPPVRASGGLNVLDEGHRRFG